MGSELEPLSSGEWYAQRIVQLWIECLQISQVAKALYLKGEYENEVNFEYIARLTRMWGELYPKIKGRTEDNMKTFSESYEKFHVYYRDPMKLVIEAAGGNTNTIIDMEEVVREALEKLKLTKYEREK